MIHDKANFEASLIHRILFKFEGTTVFSSHWVLPTYEAPNCVFHVQMLVIRFSQCTWSLNPAKAGGAKQEDSIAMPIMNMQPYSPKKQQISLCHN